LGRTARLPVRLVACRLPQEIADQRRARAKATAARKGTTVSPRQLALLAWNLFVTNAPAECLTTPEVFVLYRVRWQIELIFKVWKSEAWVARVAGWKRARVMCELYAKLIGVTLAQLWMAPLRWVTDELSLTKVVQSLQRFALRLAQSLDHPEALQHWLTQLQTIWLKFGSKDQRRTRRSTLTTLQQLSQAPGPA
jgi:Transposase DDE domain